MDNDDILSLLLTCYFSDDATTFNFSLINQQCCKIFSECINKPIFWLKRVEMKLGTQINCDRYAHVDLKEIFRLCKKYTFREDDIKMLHDAACGITDVINRALGWERTVTDEDIQKCIAEHKRTCHPLYGACLNGDLKNVKFLLDHTKEDVINDPMFIAHLLGVINVGSHFDILHELSLHGVESLVVKDLIKRAIKCKSTFMGASMSVLVGLNSSVASGPSGLADLSSSLFKTGAIVMAARSSVSDVVSRIMERLRNEAGSRTQ